MKATLSLLVVLLCLTADPAFAGSEAVVRSNHANVRARPSSFAEVLTHLKSGETVIVLGQEEDTQAKPGEPRKWSKIQMPPLVPVWVAANLIDHTTMKVKADRLNLRAGPGRNYSLLGQAARGTQVSEIRTEDGWMQIEAPASAAAYISSDLIDVSKSGKSASTLQRSGKNSSPLAQAPRGRAPGTLSPAGTLALASPPEPVVINPPTSIGDPPTDSSARLQPVVRDPGQIAEPPGIPATGETAEPVTYQEAAGATPPLASPPPSSAPGEPPSDRQVAPEPSQHQASRRIITREGRVSGSWSPHAPSFLELRSPRRGEGVMNFLFTDDARIDLARYRGKHVVATGEEWVDERWPRIPILQVEKIEAIGW